MVNQSLIGTVVDVAVSFVAFIVDVVGFVVVVVNIVAVALLVVTGHIIFTWCKEMLTWGS